MPLLGGVGRLVQRFSLLALRAVRPLVSRLGDVGPLGSTTLLLGGLGLWVTVAGSVRPDWAPDWSGWAVSAAGVAASLAGLFGFVAQPLTRRRGRAGDRKPVKTLAGEGLERLRADRDIRAGQPGAEARSKALRLWTDDWEARVESALRADRTASNLFQRDVTTKGMHWIEVPVHHLEGKLERLRGFLHDDIALTRAYTVDRQTRRVITLPGGSRSVARGAIYRFALAEFVNVGTEDLRDVAAHITLRRPDGSELSFIGRNPEPELGDRDSFDLLANGVPRACDVAFKEREDVDAYAYNTDNRREEPSWKWLPHRLPPGVYRVSVELRKGVLRESFEFDLTNLGAGQDLAFVPVPIWMDQAP